MDGPEEEEADDEEEAGAQAVDDDAGGLSPWLILLGLIVVGTALAGGIVLGRRAG